MALAWRFRCCICCCQRDSHCLRASDPSLVCTDPRAEPTSQIQDAGSGFRADLNAGSLNLAVATFFVGLPSTFSNKMLQGTPGTLEQRGTFTLALASPQYAFFSVRPRTKRPAPESRASSARLLGLLRPAGEHAGNLQCLHRCSVPIIKGCVLQVSS